MPGKSVLPGCLLAVAILAAPVLAQEGHPLTGSWHGSWGPNGGPQHPVLLYMKWDSKNIVGTINPGPNAVPLKVAKLDPENWTVHFEADGKDASGNPAHIVIDGRIANLGSYNRTITGTWTEGATKGEFKVTRD